MYVRHNYPTHIQFEDWLMMWSSIWVRKYFPGMSEKAYSSYGNLSIVAENDIKSFMLCAFYQRTPLSATEVTIGYRSESLSHHGGLRSHLVGIKYVF